MKCNILLVKALCLALAACGGGKTQLDPQARDAVVQAAERDAAKVAAAPSQSMEQQNAVLEIKIRQNQLIDAGMDDEAEIYIATVSHILVDSLHILSECR